MWLKKTQKNKPCHMKKRHVMMLQTTLLKFFSLTHQKPHNNLLLSRSSGTGNVNWHRAGGCSPSLCHCLAAASVSPAVSVSTGTRDAALAVAFKMQMHFQMQTLSVFSLFSTCVLVNVTLASNFFYTDFQPGL